MDLSVIIVSYNTAELTCACLVSVMAALGSEGEVFVVDNASTDGSAERVRDRFPSAHLIINAENRGFSTANNQAIPLCTGRYLFFLNPDTLIRQDTFTKAISFMELHTQIGLASAHIVNPDGTPQESVSLRYPGQKQSRGELDGLPGRIACVLGAAMIARTALINEIGGFDEDFFLYGEDQDLCLRIRQRGCEIGFISEAVVLHYGGQSEQLTDIGRMWRKKLLAEACFYNKHYHPETIRRIRRAELTKALYRIITLGIAMPFLRDRERVQRKLIKYRTIRDALMKKPF